MQLQPWWRRRVLGLCLGLWLPWCAAQPSRPDCPPEAQPPTPEQVQQAMAQARDRGFLWRIQKHGRTSYLYGTVHAAQPDWAYPGPQLMQAVRSSQVIALELDLLDPDIVHRMQTTLAAAPRHALPEALQQRLQQQAQAACLPEAALEGLSPEMLGVTLVLMSARREGLDPAYAIDAVYASMARGLKKPTVSLESPEAQLALLQGRTPVETREIVEQTLAELEGPNLRAVLRRLTQDWAESRLDDLAQYEQWCDCLKTPFDRATHRRMLADRNPGMARQIDALHAKGRSVFAAVGSLHMIGATGLPRLMAQKGYKVERIEFKQP